MSHTYVPAVDDDEEDLAHNVVVVANKQTVPKPQGVEHGEKGPVKPAAALLYKTNNIIWDISGSLRCVIVPECPLLSFSCDNLESKDTVFRCKEKVHTEEHPEQAYINRIHAQ